MPRFKKRPMEIEAIQFRGPNSIEPDENPLPALPHGVIWKTIGTQYLRPVLKTLEGDIVLLSGDWVVTGFNGHRFSCKPDIFESVYEPA